MLNRKLFSHRIWRAARTFSECEAWIDLIQSARFEATVTTERIGGRDITYGRGQFPASISFLVKRWGWSSDKKVRNFLDTLKKENMITTDSKQGMNIITLCKYDEYNSCEKESGKQKGKEKDIDIIKRINELEYTLGEIKASQKANKGQGEGKKNNKDNNNIFSPSIPRSEMPVAYAPGTGAPLKTWRNDYNIYLNLVRCAFKSIREDKTLLEKQQKYYPDVDIMLSIEKACTNFWATEAGWIHKKKAKSKDIDMKMTLINAIQKNRVYNGTKQTEYKKSYDNGDYLE